MFIDTLGNNVVKDAKDIACNTDHDYHRHGQTSCHSILPNQHIYITDTSHGLGDQLVPVILGIVGLCVALIVIVFGVLCFKDHCRIWLHSHYGIRIEVKKFKSNSTDPQVPILFDALVLYSNKDNDSFINVLCQNLEPTYRLCLLHRDLSGIYTSEAFKSALLASRRHLVVMSSAFMATEWQHVQDLVLNYKKLVILKVDNFQDSLPEAGLKFIQASSKVLEWSADDNSATGFWNSLRYFLPDPPRLPTKEGGAELDVSGIWTYSDNVPPNSVKKKVQCSAHSINDSGIYDSQSMHTRSCGTNVVHQRSRSALVETINGGLQGQHQRSKSLYMQNRYLFRCPTTPTTKSLSSVSSILSGFSHLFCLFIKDRGTFRNASSPATKDWKIEATTSARIDVRFTTLNVNAIGSV